MRLAFLFLAGCYSASPQANVPCAENGQCPGGQRCDYSFPTPTCVTTLAPDSNDPAIDAAIDARTDGLPAAIPPGALLWLRADDDPADGASDSAGMHAAVCAMCPAAVAGHNGSAYDFTGDRIDVSPNGDFSPGTGFSIALWLRADTAPTGAQVYTTLAASISGSAPTYGLFIDANRKIDFFTTPGGPMTGGLIVLGQWHHVAGTWDGTVKRTYVDGVQVAMASVGTLTETPNPLLLGSYNPNLPLDGALDEIFFYGRALTPLEVQQLSMQ